MALMITLGRHVPEQEHSLPGLARRDSTALGLTKPDWACRHPAVSCGGVEVRSACELFMKHPTMQPRFAAAAAAAVPAAVTTAAAVATAVVAVCRSWRIAFAADNVLACGGAAATQATTAVVTAATAAAAASCFLLPASYVPTPLFSLPASC